MRKICVPLFALAVLALALPASTQAASVEAPVLAAAPPAATTAEVAAVPITVGDLFGAEPVVQSFTPVPAAQWCYWVRSTCEPCPQTNQLKYCYYFTNCPSYCAPCSNNC